MTDFTPSTACPRCGHEYGANESHTAHKRRCFDEGRTPEQREEHRQYRIADKRRRARKAEERRKAKA